MTHGFTENSRGIGISDMANAIHKDGTLRASGKMAYHVLDTMHSIYQSAEERKRLNIESTCPQPEPLPIDYQR